MLAVGASVVARSASGGRTIPIDDFVVDFFTNALEPGEMVTEVRVPAYESPAGGAYLKLERKIGDYATVGVATHLVLDASGNVAEAGLGLTAVHGHNLKVTEAENMMVGQTPGPELFAEAGAIAARTCDPDSNVRGPAEYKRRGLRPASSATRLGVGSTSARPDASEPSSRIRPHAARPDRPPYFR